MEFIDDAFVLSFFFFCQSKYFPKVLREEETTFGLIHFIHRKFYLFVHEKHKVVITPNFYISIEIASNLWIFVISE